MTHQRRTFISLVMGLLLGSQARSEGRPERSEIIDDLSKPAPMASNGATWRVFTDTVMGGISKATMSRETIAGKSALCLRGDVKLENNGGFVQMSLDLLPDGAAFNASGWAGLEVDVFGNNENYAINLRTVGLTRPWQSYRHEFIAPARWTTIRLPFHDFMQSRTNVPLDVSQLKRIGVIAIGRSFHADIAIGNIRFFR